MEREGVGLGRLGFLGFLLYLGFIVFVVSTFEGRLDYCLVQIWYFTL